jgi:hypothetical protein
MNLFRLTPMLMVLFWLNPASAQNSKLLKKATKYLPSLTEIGFVTGAINCYVQTATLVRAVNKEIALAKSMSSRLDDLKSETEQMLGQFGSLSKINPYDMNSWVAWLDRANGLVSEETNDFVDILFNSVLKTLDERMTVGFYSQVNRGLSFDVSQGQLRAVLNAYYLGRDYQDNREKLRQVALNAKRISLLSKQGELSAVKAGLRTTIDSDMRRVMEAKALVLEKEITALEEDMLSPDVGGTTVDKQIAFLMDMVQNLGGEITAASNQLDRHQKDLAGLNQEWVLASKDKLPKSKDRSVKSPSVSISRDLYSPTDADKVPVPVMNGSRPSKQNTSETSSPTSLSDLLALQNKVELKRLEMMEGELHMDMNLAQSKAAILAVGAYQVEARRNLRTNVGFEAENLGRALAR